jgi:hypothetical protein
VYLTLSTKNADDSLIGELRIEELQKRLKRGREKGATQINVEMSLEFIYLSSLQTRK